MRTSVFLVIILIVLTLAGSSVLTAAPVPDKREWQVKSVSKFDRAVGYHFSVSPDGRFIAFMDSSSISVLDAGTSEKIFFTLLDFIDFKAVAWSPDCNKIAITESYGLFLRESDLWVIDLKAKTITDIADDGLEGSIESLKAVHPGKRLELDCLPAWSADGNFIYFVRDGWAVDAKSELCRIRPAGGKVEALFAINDKRPATIFSNLFPVNNDNQIVYAVRHYEPSDPPEGIWRVDADGRNSRLLFQAGNAIKNLLLLDVTADGKTALVMEIAGSDNPKPNTPYCFLVDLETGKARPLQKPGTGNGKFIGARYAIFSPDDKQVLYYYQQGPDRQWVLAVCGIDGNGEHVLYKPDWPLPNRVFNQRLFWIADNTIFTNAGEMGEKVFVIKLGNG